MDIKFIFEKLTSWPFLGFISLIIALILFYKPLNNILNKSDQFRFGSFEFAVNEIGQSLGISNTIKEINDLSYEELKLFLIMCGEDADYYIFTPKNIPPEKLNNIYTKFNKKGLIELIPPEQIEGYNELKKNHGIANYGIKTTEKGRLLHKVLLEYLFHEITKTKINNEGS